MSLAQGGVYINGFYNGDGWLGNSYFSLPFGYMELMADKIGADASNNQITTVGYPTYFIKDDGTKVLNGSPPGQLSSAPIMSSAAAATTRCTFNGRTCMR